MNEFRFYINSKKHGRFEVIIDEEDKERIMQYNWSVSKSNANYFRVECRMPGKKLVRLHRFILGFGPGDPEIDHKNRNPFDNRKSNLRIATRDQNMRNIRTSRKNSCGYIGVYKHYGKFRACISVNDKTVHVQGSFTTPEAAARERDKLAYKLSGEFAILNFPLTKEGE